MAVFHVDVTAEHIAAAGPAPGRDAVENPPGFEHDPVEIAIAAATGQAAMCDEDFDPDDRARPHWQMTTIGDGDSTLVNRLPDKVHTWLDAWYAGDQVEPFGFDIELEDWLVALVAKAASVEEQGDAVFRVEGRA